MIEKLNSIIKNNKCLKVSLLIVFIVQFLVLCFFNLKLLENHMGYDSSWAYLKTALIWNEKSFNSNLWADQTSSLLDSSVIFASLLYGITDKLLPSYGFVNIIILVLVLLCLNSILRLLNIGSIARWFAFNLIVCPYLTNGFSCANDLGYFSNLLSEASFYNFRIVIILLVIREFLIIRSQKRIDFFGYATFLLCILAGSSSGSYLIAVILLPYVIFELEQVFLKNDIKHLYKLESVYAYLCIGFTLTGIIIGKKIMGFSAADTQKTWSSISNLFTNFGAPLQGFLKLLGVLPVESTDIRILSNEGMYRIFPIFIFIITILSFAYAIRKVYKNFEVENDNLLFLVNIITINYLMFGLFNARYGSAVFEERYLISTFVIITIIVAYFLQNIRKDLIITKVILSALLICLICNNYVSDRKYIKSTNDYSLMAEIKTVVDSHNARLIYFWGESDVCIMGRRMRVYDMNHIYKSIDKSGGIHHWGDYKYFDDISDYSGCTILVTSSEKNNIPNYVMNEYVLIKKLGDLSVYKSKSNPIDGIAGITGTISVDYPVTPGIRVQNGQIEGRSFISNGAPGYVMYGPYSTTIDGSFDFILDYEIVEGNGAQFDVAIDYGTKQLGVCKLDPSAQEASLARISLKLGHTLEYRVLSDAGTKIRINKITVRKNE